MESIYIGVKNFHGKIFCLGLSASELWAMLLAEKEKRARGGNEWIVRAQREGEEGGERPIFER